MGARSATLSVSSLKLWRDIYYTTAILDGVHEPEGAPHDSDAWSDSEKWERLRNPEPQTVYVQPGHYLVLGDNSPESSDSRYWGLVPERLMLGRALVVYFPFERAGTIK